MTLCYLCHVSTMVTRIAPTPSGFLHRGNAFNFLLAQKIARQQKGKVFLRIDDLDAQRVRDEYLEDIFQSLAWLGIDWDIGPAGVEDFKKNWSQTLRIDTYQKTLNTLRQKNLLFACQCSRKALSGFDLYPETCLPKNILLDTDDVAWRIKLNKSTSVNFVDKLMGEINIDLHKTTGCAVVRRRDGIAAYHIASLTDDENFGINTIVRGYDLLDSSALQLHLAHQLGFEKFSASSFYHHPLLQNTLGEKLSKSNGDDSLKAMRENGLKATALIEAFETWWQGVK